MNFDIDPREINLQGPDGMQLVKLLRGLIAAIESGGDEPEPGEDSEIFYCTYGTTTYSEIQNALAEDKVPICIRNGLYYYLVNTTQNRYVFACYNPTNNYIYAVRCLTDRWDNVTFMLQERLTWDYAPTQGSIRPVTSGGVWTALQNAGGSDIDPYQQYPEMDGTASPGSSGDYARGDHVHPTDTSRAAATDITRIDAALAGKADAATVEQFASDAADAWLDEGYIWERAKPYDSVIVKFGGKVERSLKDGQMEYKHVDYTTVRAVPYDVPILGFGGRTVNTLHLWDAQPVHDTIDMKEFNAGNYSAAMKERSETLSG